MACCLAALAVCIAPSVSAQEPGAPQGLTELSQDATRFVVTRGEGRFRFALEHEGVILLRSPGYATQRAVSEAMDEVRTQARRLKHLPLRTLTPEQHYFVVQDTTGGVLATSLPFGSREEALAARQVLKLAIRQLK